MKPIFWIASLVMASSFATAQRHGLSTEVTGSGSLTRDREQYDLRGVSLDLRDNGSATITLIGSRRWTYQGTWRATGDDYIMEIHTAYGDSRAEGTVRISMDRGDLDSISLRDGYADRARFSASFDAREDNSAVVGSGTTRGNGTYTAPDSRGKNVTSVSHSFNRDGTFTIRPSGGETFGGRYTRSGNTLRLTVTEVGRNRVNSGSGNATINGRTLATANLSARTSRGSYGLSWRADRDGGGQAGRPFRFDERGRGNATAFSGRNLELDRATGDFRSDGKFTIWLYDGSRRISVEGRWNDGYFFGGNNGRPGDDRFQSGNRVVLEMEKYDGRSARGTGTYDLNNSDSIFAKLSIVGTAGRDKIVVGFTRMRR